MKLVKTQLRRYRSIEDGGEFDVEPDVTCLVGKNESGKTAVLQAMYKSHAVDKAKFDIGLDYPSRLTREKRGSDEISVSILTYELAVVLRYVMRRNRASSRALGHAQKRPRQGM